MKVTGLRMLGMAGAALVLAACGGPTPATAPPTIVSRTVIIPISPDRVTQPVFTEMPSAEALSEAYPGFAVEFDITARVGLRCLSKVEGHLDECIVTSASPDGLGFAEAALSLTPLIRVSPRRIDGEAMDSRVVFSINFAPAPDDPIPPWTEAEPSPDQVARLRPVAREMIATDTRLFRETDGVDPDRVAVVLQIQQDARGRYLEDMVDAMALSLARVLTPEQIDAFVEGRPPPGREPDAKRTAASADRAWQVDARYRKFVRERYCEVYDC